MSSVIEPGVYRRSSKGKLEAVQFDLNNASNTNGNGINLMPATPVPDVNGPTALVITRSALKRLFEEIKDEL